MHLRSTATDNNVLFDSDSNPTVSSLNVKRNVLLQGTECIYVYLLMVPILRCRVVDNGLSDRQALCLQSLTEPYYGCQRRPTGALPMSGLAGIGESGCHGPKRAVERADYALSRTADSMYLRSLGLLRGPASSSSSLS